MDGWFARPYLACHCPARIARCIVNWGEKGRRDKSHTVVMVLDSGALRIGSGNVSSADEGADTDTGGPTAEEEVQSGDSVVF